MRRNGTDEDPVTASWMTIPVAERAGFGAERAAERRLTTSSVSQTSPGSAPSERHAYLVELGGS
jgi:hypothetical protein